MNELDEALSVIGRQTMKIERLSSLLSRAYLVGPNDTLIHYPCGEEGVAVRDGEIISICSCVPPHTADSVSKEPAKAVE